MRRANRRFARFGARVAAALVAAVLAAWWLHLRSSSAFAPIAPFVLAAGVFAGFCFQRSRFCFYCALRDLFEDRDGRGLLGIIAALAIGVTGTLAIVAAWVPDPQAGHLPPGAHIGPLSWVVLLGGLIFGWGMALSGSCISAHLYRLGEGSLLAPVALLGSMGGFVLGFLAWNPLYVRTIATAPIFWIPAEVGYPFAWTLQLALLAIIAVMLLRGLSTEPCEPEAGLAPPPFHLRDLWQAIFVRRWPAWVGGTGMGVLSFLLYLRHAPLGVTSQLGTWSRAVGNRTGIVPVRLEGLDGLAGCATATTGGWLNDNGIFLSGLVGGALVGGLLSGRFRPQRKTLRQFVFAFLGGVLLGFGAMISLGCTIGTLFSGITAFAATGWAFAASMTLGVWSGIQARPWLKI